MGWCRVAGEQDSGALDGESKANLLQCGRSALHCSIIVLIAHRGVMLAHCVSTLLCYISCLDMCYGESKANLQSIWTVNGPLVNLTSHCAVSYFKPSTSITLPLLLQGNANLYSCRLHLMQCNPNLLLCNKRSTYVFKSFCQTMYFSA